MAYQALYRTYRPSNFSEMAGQKHILRTLHNAVRQNKIAHAYLFTGPRGTGKTSVARILAKAVNCLHPESEQFPCNDCVNCLGIQAGNHPDIIEIDAASNNGVDEVRDLIEKVKYAPISGKYKVYIIDEVHMMSTGAFNALLKTLEEPPEHVLFILATTEPHKILPTIISRCQRFDFTKIPDVEIQSIIREVIAKENVTCDDETIRLISSLADGGMRDALSILDQCIAYAGNSINIAIINEIYGITTVTEKIKLLQYVKDKDIKSLLAQIHVFLNNGIDVKRLCINLMEILKESIIYQLTASSELITTLSEEEAKTLSDMFQPRQKFMMIEALIDCQEKFKFASNLASYFELALLKMASYEEHLPHISNQQPVRSEKGSIKQEVRQNSQPAPEFVNQPVTGPIPFTTQTPAKEVTVAQILNLMVQASKEDRREAERLWATLPDYYMNVQYRKAAKWLNDGVIVASNQDFVLLSCKHQMMADLINSESHQTDILNLTNALFGSPRLAFAISDDKCRIAIQEYKQLSNRNALPQPIKIEVRFDLPQEDNATTDEVEQKLKEICGDILEIVED